MIFTAVLCIVGLCLTFTINIAASSLEDPSAPDFSNPEYKAVIPFVQSAGSYIKPGEIFENFEGEVFVYNNQDGTVPPERFNLTLVEGQSLEGWDYHINYDPESDIQGEFLSLYWLPFKNMTPSSTYYETDIEIEFRFNFKYAYYAYSNGYTYLQDIATSMACYVSGIRSTHYTLYYNTGEERFPLRAFAPDNSPTNHIDTYTTLYTPYDPEGYFSIVFSIPETDFYKTSSTLFLYVTPRNYITLYNPLLDVDDMLSDFSENQNIYNSNADWVINGLKPTLPEFDYIIEPEDISVISRFWDRDSVFYSYVVKIGTTAVFIITVGYIFHGKKRV